MVIILYSLDQRIGQFCQYYWVFLVPASKEVSKGAQLQPGSTLKTTPGLVAFDLTRVAASRV